MFNSKYMYNDIRQASSISRNPQLRARLPVRNIAIDHCTAYVSIIIDIGQR